MTDIHDIKPIMSAPFPWLFMLLVLIGLYFLGKWLYNKYILPYLQKKEAQVQKRIAAFNFMRHSVNELRTLLAQVDSFYEKQKEAHLYALISYWIRFYLEHKTEQVALTMTKTEIQKNITDRFTPYLSTCYKIEFAKQTSTPAQTKELLQLVIKEIEHGA